MALRTDYVNETAALDAHPGAHNDANAQTNANTDKLATHDSQIASNASAITANTNAIARALNYGEDPTTFGFASMSRRGIVASSALSANSLVLAYITPSATVTVTKMRCLTGTTAAVGVTLARMGVYQEAGDGTLTLVASTPNDTTLFVAADTSYTKALSASVQLTAGQRYALAVMVAASTMPQTLGGVNYIALRPEYQVAPRQAAAWTGTAISDLPATIPPANIGVNQIMRYLVAVP